jgi:hypothetical protein
MMMILPAAVLIIGPKDTTWKENGSGSHQSALGVARVLTAILWRPFVFAS